MPPIEYPNLGLKAGFVIGEEGWADEMTDNIKLLSIVGQGRALDKVAVLPGAPVDGDVYILDETDVTNPNAIAAYIVDTWEYFTPLEGWLIYNIAAGYYEQFDGTVWAELETGGASTLDALTDVDTSTTPPADQQALIWDDALSQWVPGDVAAGGGGSFAPRQVANVAFHWTGSAVVIDKSNGVASVVRTGAGRYTINFSTPFSDAFYTVGGLGVFPSGSDDLNYVVVGLNRQGTKDVDSCDIVLRNANDHNTADSDIPTVLEFEELTPNVYSLNAGATSVELTPLPAFQNGWVNLGGGFMPLTIIKTGRIVTINGLLKDGTDNTVAFTLPVGWRPSATITSAVHSNIGHGNVRVADDGTVNVQGSTTFTYVEISFIVPESDAYNGGSFTSLSTVTDAAYTVLGTEGFVLFDRATAQVVTLPAAIGIGFQISGKQLGAGELSFVAGAGAAILSPDAMLAVRVQYSSFTATKISATEWSLAGDLA